MAFTRRFLPSMQVLCAFEAAARLQSFTAAADELSLTQSAVSRQIRALEQTLGGELFHRERQTVRLTRAGESYAREIRDSLTKVSAATLGFRANPRGGSLNLAALPTFCARWLAPRLPDFFEKNPDIIVNLNTRLAPFDFDFDTMDAAIHFGLPEWPGADLDVLMGEEVVPVCSRRLYKTLDIEAPGDLLDAPLLHLISRPDAWERWFRAMDVAFDDIHGMLTDNFAVSTQTAIAGLGIALLPRFLIGEELERGELVIAYDAPQASVERYFLAWPARSSEYPPLVHFREWILSQCSVV